MQIRVVKPSHLFDNAPGQRESLDEFYEAAETCEFSVPSKNVEKQPYQRGDWSRDSTDIPHLANDTASGVAGGGYKIDPVRGLVEKRPKLVHFCAHAPRPDPWNPAYFMDARDHPLLGTPHANQIPASNQHWYFNKDDWINTVNTNNPGKYTQLQNEWNAQCIAVGHPNGVDGMLDYCEKVGCCIVGSLIVETNSYPPPPNKLDFSPHVDQPGDNPRAYARVSTGLAGLAHQYKGDRYYCNGPGKKSGKRATCCVIEGKYINVVNRVGLTGCTEDLAGTELPLPIHTIYEVIWDERTPGVHRATWIKIYEDYEWMEHPVWFYFG